MLHADPWETFALPSPDRAGLQRQLDEGAYVSDGDEGWWICDDEERVGVLRITDLATDWDPQLAIRLLPAARGRGLGRAGTVHATERVFSRPRHHRFEAQTRVDNTPMRQVFVSLGWVLEACYRQAWPRRDGTRVDSVGYALLRCDWEQGTRTTIDWTRLEEGYAAGSP